MAAASTGVHRVTGKQSRLASMRTVAIRRCSAPNRAAVLCALLSLLERRPQRIILLEASAERGARLCVSTSIAATLMEI
jgi:hypothetical protein